MWDFKDKSLSMYTPRNFVQSICVDSILSILNKSCTCNVLLKSIKWVLSMLSDSLLACIQDCTSLSSLFKVLTRMWGLRCVRNKLESSAKHMNESVCEEFWRSFIYKMNNNWPKREPWGTPHEIDFSSDSWPLILTNCFLFVK